MRAAPDDAPLTQTSTGFPRLVDEVDAILWSSDPETFRFHYVSKGAERILGYPVQEWLERDDFWISILHPDDRDRTVEYCRQQTSAGRDHEFRYRAIAADGRVVWLRDNVRVELDASGAPQQLHGVMFDVTDRQTRSAQQAAVAHLGTAALSLRWPELLRETVRVLAETLGDVVVEIIEIEGGSLVPRATSWDLPLVTGKAASDREGLWVSAVLESSGPLVVPKIAEGSFGADERLSQIGAASAIGSLIVGTEGQPRGLIGIYSAAPRSFSADDAHFVGSVGAILASAASRESVERELERRENQLATAQEIARLGSWEWIPEMGDVWWSEELFEVHGQDPATFAPSFESFLSIVIPEDRERVIASIEESVETGGDLEFDYGFVRSDGTRRLGHALARWVSVGTGSPDRVIGTVQDVTESKEADMRVRESEQRLRAIFEHGGFGIATVSPRGRVREANRAMHDLLGYPPGELRGMHFTELTHPEDAEIDRTLYRELLDGQREEYTLEKRFIRKDGRQVWGSLTARAVRDHLGEATMAVAMVNDITLRKKIVEDLVESRAQLAEKSEQSIRLARRLVEAQEIERRNIAHDLHDEVGQILTGLKLTLEAAPASESAGDVAGRALPLVEDLISLIRDMTLTLRPPMLDDLGLLPTLRWHISRYEHSTDVSVRFTHNGLDRRFDPNIETAVYRVLQEALTNVARHAQTRTAFVNVETTDGHLHVDVSDEGVGFEVDRLDPSTHGVVGMRERFTSLGGTLTLESSPGRGTLLRARLPIGEAR